MVSVDVKHHVYLLASCSKVLKIVEAIISTSVICGLLVAEQPLTRLKLQATAAIFTLGYVSFQTSLCPRFCSSSVIISNSLFAFSSSWQWMTEEVSTESGGWRPARPVCHWVPAAAAAAAKADCSCCSRRWVAVSCTLSLFTTTHNWYVYYNLATTLCLLCTIQLISNCSATPKQR